MPDLKATLTKKIGPAPVWVYVTLAGGAGYYIYKKRRGSASTTATPTATSTDTGAQTTPDQSSGMSALPDASGGVSGGATGGGGSGGVSGGTLDTSGGTSGFSTGPQAPPAGFTYDSNGNVVPTSQVQTDQVLNFISTLASEGYSYNATTGEVIPIGSGGSPSTLGNTPSPTITTPPATTTTNPYPGDLGNTNPSGGAGNYTPPPPPTPISTNTSSPDVHLPTTTAPIVSGIAAKYGATYTGTAAQNNVVQSFLKSHYNGTALTTNLRRATTDQSYASNVYATVLRQP